MPAVKNENLDRLAGELLDEIAAAGVDDDHQAVMFLHRLREIRAGFARHGGGGFLADAIASTEVLLTSWWKRVR